MKVHIEKVYLKLIDTTTKVSREKDFTKGPEMEISYRVSTIDNNELYGSIILPYEPIFDIELLEYKIAKQIEP